MGQGDSSPSFSKSSTLTKGAAKEAAAETNIEPGCIKACPREKLLIFFAAIQFFPRENPNS